MAVSRLGLTGTAAGAYGPFAPKSEATPEHNGLFTRLALTGVSGRRYAAFVAKAPAEPEPEPEPTAAPADVIWPGARLRPRRTSTSLIRLPSGRLVQVPDDQVAAFLRMLRDQAAADMAPAAIEAAVAPIAEALADTTEEAPLELAAMPGAQWAAALMTELLVLHYQAQDDQDQIVALLLAM